MICWTVGLGFGIGVSKVIGTFESTLDRMLICFVSSCVLVALFSGAPSRPLDFTRGVLLGVGAPLGLPWLAGSGEGPILGASAGETRQEASCPSEKLGVWSGPLLAGRACLGEVV